jgi:histidinol-phosphate aminotransferase
MEMFIKQHIKEMRRYQTSLGRDLDNGIRLDRNEKVSEFTKEQMNEIFGIFNKYSLSASPEALPLYKKIAETLEISINNIFVTSGITEGIRILYDFCTNPGENVICLDPTYPMYWIYADMYQVEYRKMSYDTVSLTPDLETLYSQLDEKTRFVFIANPNLPIESCFNVDDIRDIAEKCRENNTVLVVDEAYYHFGAPSMLELIDEFENIIVFRTLSKAYGLAGLRIGFMVSQSQNINNISKSRSLVESNTLSMQIAEHFLEHSEFRDQHVREVKEGSAYLQKQLSQLNLRWYGGNYTNGILIFLKNKEASVNLVRYMKDKGIYIRGSFDPPFDTTIRVSIGSREYMERFVNSLKEWLE